jgi:hypothetical protein
LPSPHRDRLANTCSESNRECYLPRLDGSVAAPPAHAVRMTRPGDSEFGPESRRRRAADRQQPVFVTTGEPARNQWRIMTADSGIDGR